MSERYNALNQEAQLYKKWNSTTASCYYHKMICKNCPNEWACKRSDDFNQYHIKQVKYATLMTYRNLGKKGLSRYVDIKE